jgi:hypothetical protein
VPNIDFAALRAARQPQQAAPIAPQQPQRREWLRYAAFAIAAILLALWLSGRGPSPTPGPGPNPIDAEGLHVLVMTPADLAGLSKEQKEFLASAKVADWVESNQGKYRSYPQSQNINNEDLVWREIRGQLAPPYLVGVLKNRRLTKMEAPQGIDAGIAALERVR